eukprot:6148256-Amphidinium_carterae.1
MSVLLTEVCNKVPVLLATIARIFTKITRAPLIVAIGVPDLKGVAETVNLSSLINQKGRTPEALVVYHHGQRLSQSHLGLQREYSVSKGNHDVESRAVPVHPHSREKSSDPDTHSYHIPEREYNRVSRWAHLSGWVCDIRSIAGYL